MVCGGASASVDSDLSGYFRLDVDTLGFVMPTASQGRIFDSMHSDPLSESRPMRGFCELKIVASGFREKMLVTDMYPEGQMGTIILQPIRNPVQWSISTNTLLAPRSAVAKFEKARRFAGKKQFERAEEELKKAVAEYERYGLAWVELGYMQLRGSRLVEATASFQTALLAGEKTPGLYYGLAKACEQAGQRAESAKWAKMALTLQGGPDAVRFKGR